MRRMLIAAALLAAALPVSMSGNGTAVTRIHDIQGAGHRSPLAGQSVTGVQGIVFMVVSNGFYMQDPTPDADVATSEGIFVFTSSTPAVAVGELVSVSGNVSEFRPGGSLSSNLSVTQIVSPTVVHVSTGNAFTPTLIGINGRVPPATVIEDDATGDVESSGTFDPDNDGIDFYESLEGMFVQIDDVVVAGATENFGTNFEIPVLIDKGANSSLRTNRGGIVLRSTDPNPERIILNGLPAILSSVNVGDTFAGPIRGVIDYSFGNFKLRVGALPAVVSGGLAAETAAEPVTGEIAIATYELANLMPAESGRFASYAGHIVNNLKSPDIVAVQGIADSSGPADDGTLDASTTYNSLIAAIQSAGGPTYQYRQIDPVNGQDGGLPAANIRVAFLFRTDRGLSFLDRPGGTSTIGTSVVSGVNGPELTYSPGRIDPTNPAFNSSRKPLAGEFTFNGRHFFVIVNHFNSKGGDDPLFGRFQPPNRVSEIQRGNQAQVVHDFVASILALDANANVVVLGDLNDFQFSNPMATLEGTILHNLTDSLAPEERYSYVFDGNSEALDHILVSDALFNGSPVYDIVHVNAEFAVQTSDHDPAVARFQTAANQLTELSPAKVWIGLKNSDSVGLRVDLLAEVFLKNGAATTLVGSGELDNQSTGSSGFNNALLDTITLALTGGAVTVAPDSQLQMKLSVRRTCSGAGQNSGSVRLWYNGKEIDTGAARDAGSRFDATIGGQTSKLFLRTNFALDTVAGVSRTFLDATVDSKVPCGSGPPYARPFTAFGTWSLNLP